MHTPSTGDLTNVGSIGVVSDPAGPERALLRAVLIRAIQDYTQAHVTKDGTSRFVPQKHTVGAGEWFEEDSRPAPEFSFVWVCEQLDLCPDTIRPRLRRLRERLETQGPIHAATFLSRINALISGAYGEGGTANEIHG